MAQASLVILTNYIPPYRLPLFERLQDAVPDLCMLVSTPMEKNRSWEPDFGKLWVIVQRTLTFRTKSRHPVGFSASGYVHAPYDTLPVLWRLNPRVIVSHELGLRSLQCAIYKMLRPRTFLIYWLMYSEHTERARGWARRALRRFLIKFCDAVFVNGESGARYAQSLGIPHVKTQKVYKAAEIERFRRPDKKEKRCAVRDLLVVGQLVPLKGLEVFFDVLSSWAKGHPERGLNLSVVGQGPQRASLERLALPKNVAVKFLGSVSYEEMPSVYHRADLLVFPTLGDEWGMVVNEAMAAGVPVLGSIYSHAVEEMVVPGETGWRFRSDDRQSFMEALDAALEARPETLDHMRRACEKQSQHFTIDIVAERMLAVIRPALS